MNRHRLAKTIGVIALTAAGMLVVGAVAGGVGEPSQPTGVVAGRAVAAPPAQNISRADATSKIAGLQTRLRSVPNDWQAWSNLGALYTAQARLTADPSYYGKADGAFARSLKIRPDDNAGTLTGQATLAASRHDFAGALRLTKRADAINPYGATNLGVMFDALGELGRYDDAFAALQRMLDLKPGVPSYTRASYSFELRGDVKGARFALEQALDAASAPVDVAFAQQYLGELAYNAGDLDTAAKHFTEGLRRAPAYVPLLAGRARVEAARGQDAAALRDWTDVTNRLPQTTYLIEYADLLASLGREEEARRQYAVVDATAKLFRAAGANVDLELSLFEADHGRADEAVATAGGEVRRRQSIHVEDAYAWALHAAGRDREALVHAKAAAHLGMRNALFAYHRGMIEKALGRRADATKSLKRALDINPYFSPLQSPKARAALAELEKGR